MDDQFSIVLRTLRGQYLPYRIRTESHAYHAPLCQGATSPLPTPLKT